MTFSLARIMCGCEKFEEAGMRTKAFMDELKAHDLLMDGEVGVDSVHGQGIDRLAEGLRVEALAPDGLVEAFSVADAPGFSLCVQWHPEFHVPGSDTFDDAAVLNDFLDAALAAQERSPSSPLTAAKSLT